MMSFQYSSILARFQAAGAPGNKEARKDSVDSRSICASLVVLRELSRCKDFRGGFGADSAIDYSSTASRAKPHSTTAPGWQTAAHQCGPACLRDPAKSLQNLLRLRPF